MGVVDDLDIDLMEDLKTCRFMAVYGTLRPGFHNNCLMEGFQHIGTGKSEFWGTMFSNGGFPILSCLDASTKIVVDLYKIPVDDAGVKAFEDVDGLEGYPYWYDRTIKTFKLNTGEEVKAWIYHQDAPSNLPEVDSGDWKQYKEKS